MRVPDLIVQHAAVLTEAESQTEREGSHDEGAHLAIFNRLATLEEGIIVTRSDNLSGVKAKVDLALGYARDNHAETTDDDELPHEWRLVESAGADIDALLAGGVPVPPPSSRFGRRIALFCVGLALVIGINSLPQGAVATKLVALVSPEADATPSLVADVTPHPMLEAVAFVGGETQ